MPVPSGPGPHTFSKQVGPWQVHLHAHQGEVRHRIEDAWAVVAGAPLGARLLDAFAVFDGLGGAPNGQEAAWAAADHLAQAIHLADAPDAVLRYVNDVVLPTGGSTTATMLLVARGSGPGPFRGWMLSIGDSSIYRLDDHGFTRLNEHDRKERHVLSDWLGRTGISGHVREVAVGPGETFVLCTDGADEVAGEDAVRRVAEAKPEETPGALDRLFEETFAAGAPDNAAVLVVRHTEGAILQGRRDS